MAYQWRCSGCEKFNYETGRAVTFPEKKDAVLVCPKCWQTTPFHKVMYDRVLLEERRESELEGLLGLA